MTISKKEFLEEWLNDPSELPTPEEREQDEAEREARKGTMTESAMMLANGEIDVRSWGYDIDGSRGDGGFTIYPADDDYEDAKKQYGLTEPGHEYLLKKKLVDGEWIVLEERRPGDKEDESS